MRALHLDLKLVHYRPDYLESLFARLGGWGYTHVLIELEDKVRLDCLADAVWCEAYSKETFSAILAAARRAGLEPVPLVQTLGHLEYLLSHAAFHHLREGKPIASTLCPTHPETLPFLRRYIDEVAELFGQPALFHVGADEVWLLGSCERCQAQLAGRPKWALFADHLRAVVDHVIKRGMRPIAWADIALAHADTLEGFPRDVIWMDWDYWTMEEHPTTFRDWGMGKVSSVAELSATCRNRFGPFLLTADDHFRAWGYTDYLMAQGFEVIVAPAMRSGGDNAWAPNRNHLGNVFEATRRLQRSPAPLGLAVTSWAVRQNHLELQLPGFQLPALQPAHPGAARWADLPFAEDPRLFQAWELLSPSIPFSTSNLAIRGGDIYGYGSMESLRIAYREAKLDPAAELDRLAPIAAGYQAAGQLLKDIAGDSLALDHWRLAAQALSIKAEECRLTLRALSGQPDPEAATELLLLTESVRDRHRQLLLQSCTPASAEREVDMLYGAALYHQYKLAWNRPL